MLPALRDLKFFEKVEGEEEKKKLLEKKKKKNMAFRDWLQDGQPPKKPRFLDATCPMLTLTPGCLHPKSGPHDDFNLAAALSCEQKQNSLWGSRLGI